MNSHSIGWLIDETLCYKAALRGDNVSPCQPRSDRRTSCNRDAPWVVFARASRRRLGSRAARIPGRQGRRRPCRSARAESIPRFPGRSAKRPSPWAVSSNSPGSPQAAPASQRPAFQSGSMDHETMARMRVPCRAPSRMPGPDFHPASAPRPGRCEVNLRCIVNRSFPIALLPSDGRTVDFSPELPVPSVVGPRPDQDRIGNHQAHDQERDTISRDQKKTPGEAPRGRSRKKANPYLEADLVGRGH